MKTIGITLLFLSIVYKKEYKIFHNMSYANLIIGSLRVDGFASVARATQIAATANPRKPL